MCQGIIAGHISLKRTQCLRRAWCETGSERHGVEGKPYGLRLAVVRVSIPNERWAFWNKVLMMGLFQWALGLFFFFFLTCLIFQRGLRVHFRMRLFLSHKRKVIICLALLYLKPSVEASGRALPGVLGTNCAWLCRLMKISVTGWTDLQITSRHFLES